LQNYIATETERVALLEESKDHEALPEEAKVGIDESNKKEGDSDDESNKKEGDLDSVEQEEEA
jgi:hypothetical protein